MWALLSSNRPEAEDIRVLCNIVDQEGMFKATALWEKIIAHLEKSVKCGRHTQSLRTYTNCFQGSKAVDCLLSHLNVILPAKKTVKRNQVQVLCQKLALMGVIEDVKEKEKCVFREGRLYRLTRNHFWSNPITEVRIQGGEKCINYFPHVSLCRGNCPGREVLRRFLQRRSLMLMT